MVFAKVYIRNSVVEREPIQGAAARVQVYLRPRMLLYSSGGLNRGPHAHATSKYQSFLYLCFLLSTSVLSFAYSHTEKQNVLQLLLTPFSLAALAIKSPLGTSSMPTTTTPTGRTSAAGSDPGGGNGLHQLHAEVQAKATVYDQDDRTHNRQALPIARTRVHGAGQSATEAMKDFKLAVSSLHPRFAMEHSTEEMFSRGSNAGLSVLDLSRSQRKWEKPANDSGKGVPPCGEGRLRVDHECVPVLAEEQYDYIIVGCGAVGCPLAKTLADGGNKVLVLERGHKRSYRDTPSAMDIFGAGKAVSDASIAQLVQTNQGVRTQTAGIMGGGTSINMGIVAMENRRYFDNLNRVFGWKFDFSRLEKAFKWVSKAFHTMPQDAKYGSRLRMTLQRHGHRPLYNRHANIMDKSDKEQLVDHSSFLHEGYVWGGATLFNPKKKFARDAADIFLYNSTSDQSSTQAGELIIKERQYVEVVLFETVAFSTQVAACVRHRPTRKEDMAPLGLGRSATWQARKKNSANSFLKYLFRQVGHLFTSVLGLKSSARHLSCIKKGGEIFLSAGAVHTPLLLFRSGIGPSEQLTKLGVEPVYVNAHVGRHLTDRVLVPISLFANELRPRSTRQPRMCQVLGMRRVGPACKGVRVNERTLMCSLIATEELSGPNLMHGLLWASHLLFPPSWRDHPALSAALELAQLCEEKLHFRGTLQYPSVCLFLEGYIDCLELVIFAQGADVNATSNKIADASAASCSRSFSLFYFTTEPKSRGYIRQHEAGEVEIEANYLRDEQDLFDAVRGTQALIQMVNSGLFDDIAEPLHATSCPVTMLRTLVDLFLRFAQAKDLQQYREQLLSVRRHAADLQPPRQDAGRLEWPQYRTDFFAPTELSPVRPNGFAAASARNTPRSNTTEKLQRKLSALDTKGNLGDASKSSSDARSYETALHEVFKNRKMLEKLFQQTDQDTTEQSVSAAGSDSGVTTATNPSLSADVAHDLEACVDPRACDEGAIHNEAYTTTCLAHDVFSKRFNLPRCTPSENEERMSSPEGVVNTEEWLFHLVKRGLNLFFAADLPAGSSQTLATYPPILPRADDPEEVAAFALTYMTSIWHIGGTAAMGLVVDEMFRVKGVKGLSVADASLLNQMTRLNPTATLMTLGRYIGLLRLESRIAADARVHG